MRLDDYTPDSICKAMGLASFAADPSLVDSPALRLVFLPSFHPETVVTFQQLEGSSKVSVTALKRMLWHEQIWARMPEVSTESRTENLSFSELLAAFVAAHKSLEPGSRAIAIDGMSIAACCYSASSKASFNAHCSASDAVQMLAAKCLYVAWESALSAPAAANALANAAQYVGVTLPLVSTDPEPTIKRLLILGTPEARRDYFDLLSKSRRRQT